MKLNLKFSVRANAPSPKAMEISKAILSKVVAPLKAECKKAAAHDDMDMVYSYACDWIAIAHDLAQGNEVAAQKRFSSMDTASRDYISELPSIYEAEIKSIFKLDWIRWSR